MASRTISQLDITENVIGTEYLLIDDTERTTRATVQDVGAAINNIFTTSFANISSFLSVFTVASGEILVTGFNTLSSELTTDFNTLSSELTTGLNTVSGELTTGFSTLSGDLTTGFNTVSGELTTGFSALSSELTVGFNTVSGELTTGFNTLSGDLTTEVNALSNFVYTKTSKVNVNASNTGSITFALSDTGTIKTYSNTDKISAYITSDINVEGFTVTLAQLSTGTIEIVLGGSYTSGNIITFGGLIETAGAGATASITRVSNNTFLVTGLLQ